MISWCNPKFTVLWTNYTNFFFVTHILHLGIIILITVNSFSLFNKLFCCFVSTETLRATYTVQMNFWQLPNFSMNRTDNAYWSFGVNILYLGVVVFITVNFTSFLDEIFC